MPDVDFKSLLSAQVDSVERPPTFPAGPYSAIVAAHEFGTSSKKGTPYCRFEIKLISPQEGVDQELFEDAGGMEKLAARKNMNLDFYLTEDAYYRLREFLENTMEINCSGSSFDKKIPEALNLPLTGEIDHREGQKPGEWWMNIADTSRAV